MRINEENFVRQLEQGNEKALDYVTEQYGGLLISIIRKHLYAFEHLQEECFNDVLLGIWNNIRYFDETRNSFKNWAAGVARFKSLDYLRKYMKELHQESWEQVVGAKEDDRMLAILETEISEETELMLSCLSREDRELFIRLYVQEDSPEDIAKDSGMKKSVIYNRVSRGKKKLRELFPREKGAKNYE